MCSSSKCCMDGREAMALSSGSSPYYIDRGEITGSGSASGSQPNAFYAPPGFRPVSTNTHIQAQSNAWPSSAAPKFPIEPSHHGNVVHNINMGVSTGVPPGHTAKKKRGRPRKYAPDGAVSLGLSPISVKSKASSDSGTSFQKRGRGRPPGTGRKQQLATLGEWMNSSAGMAFSPHVIDIGVGEDIVEKMLSFSQQRPRALCILSGSGTVSSATLRQPASMAPTVTYEGRFEILCLSGSYLLAEDGGPRNRSGGISASLSSPDGHVIGGGVGRLIALSPAQVVCCSFIYGGSKSKDKQLNSCTADTDSALPSTYKSASPASAPARQNFSPSPVSVWPGSQPIDLRNPHSDIDLMRG
ncbi:AT_hook domain-containing protein/DUF296 domain-containing protein [Cephalotus follicularis]|uniref:AT-hook motif nuclear-localized protein n=1 Tax=Cephalotus follicularis TaxID=3775 RepID=A0A1Q3AQA0_CEPFO|nr:AT_hook domain-containing protein/DUF296 domain-containing protein [Cephalotus follicularis]